LFDSEILVPVVYQKYKKFKPNSCDSPFSVIFKDGMFYLFQTVVKVYQVRHGEVRSSKVKYTFDLTHRRHVDECEYLRHVLSVGKVLSGSCRVGRLRLIGKYIGHRHVARPEPDNAFWTDRG